MKPAIPSGTRDFSPLEVSRRNYIFSVIKERFERYGYQPIETPAMENLSTLMGKYGEEGDKLLYKIRSNKNLLEYYPELKKYFSPKSVYPYEWIPMASDKALRYDLTVPFARFVVQHQNELIFPFKRYQIQPVWRADRPQKGRYREFFQCDADVIGSSSMLNEVELIQIIYDVFQTLKIPITVKINNRKILNSLLEIIGIPQKNVKDVLIAIDKIEKIGRDEAFNELEQKGFLLEHIQNIKKHFYPLMSDFDSTISEQLITIFNKSNSKTGKEAIGELQCIRSVIEKIYDRQLKWSEAINPNHPRTTYWENADSYLHILFDISLARGLDYYTGTIFEVVTGSFPGSVCGGGRYDDLTSIFGLPNISGVGISFGAERIYDILTEMNLFPESLASAVQLLFVNFGGEEETASLQMLQKVRAEGINAEIYPDAVKIKKQFEYANKKGVRFVAAIGSDERKNNTISLKNMETGNQIIISSEELITQLVTYPPEAGPPLADNP